MGYRKFDGWLTPRQRRRDWSTAVDVLVGVLAMAALAIAAMAFYVCVAS